MISEKDKINTELKTLLVSKNEDEKSPEKEITLKNLTKHGLWVLYFYPKDSTPGCTLQARNIRDNLESLSSHKIQIYGISRDSHQSHCKFIKKENVNFNLLSDHTGKVSENFGVWVEKNMYGKKYMGIQRTTFLIKKDMIVGVIKKVDTKNHAEQILDLLKEKKIIK